MCFLSHTSLRQCSPPCTNNMAARQQRSRRVMLRERNERGFALFLQNLKSVLNILANIGETDILVETRYRLLDASGTLSFLMNDLAGGVTNVTGIPSSALQAPVQNMNHSLT